MEVSLMTLHTNSSGSLRGKPSSDAICISLYSFLRLYVKFSHAVVKFPYKQRTALLIDLANRMDFNLEPTPLQKAFLGVGIRLQDYQQPLSEDARGRSRHASNTSHAYKRTREWAKNNIHSD